MKKNRLFAMLMALALTLAMLPAAVFAEGEEAPQSDAELTIQAASATLTIKDGSPLEWFAGKESPRIPNLFKDGNVITLTRDGNTKDFTYHENEGTYKSSDGEELTSVSENDKLEADGKSVKVSIEWDGGIDNQLDIIVPVKEPKSITLSPSSVELTTEEALYYDENDIEHYGISVWDSPVLNGNTWHSAFKEGATITLNYKDGTSRVFTNTWVRQSAAEMGVEGYEDFFMCGKDKMFVSYSPKNLNLGTNNIIVTAEEYDFTAPYTVTLKQSAPTPAPTPEAAPVGTTAAAENGTVTVKSDQTVEFTQAVVGKKKKSVTVPATAVVNGKTYNVTSIGPNAFKGTKVTSVTAGANIQAIAPGAFKGSKVKTLTVKNGQLTAASVAGSLKGSKIKTVKVKVGSKKTNKATVKVYKKVFSKKNAGKKVKVK